jgi:hypothetical protein
MVKRYSGATAGERVAGLLRRRGLDVDPLRLDEGAAALRSRAKAEDAAHLEQVEAAAFAAKKARRACELAEWWWRRSPNSETLAKARAAQQARSAAETELRELLLNDEQLIADVQRRYGW